MKKNIIVLFLMQLLVMGIIGSFPGHAQATLNQAGLVVQFGDGRIETECVKFEEESITGYQVLERSGFEFTPSFYSGQGWAICKIEEDGCPANDCFCDPNVFWSYWSLDDGAWLYSSLGSSNFHVHNRDVQGWRWGEGVAPEQIYTINQICVQPATPTNTIVPTTVSVQAVFGETNTSTPQFTNTPVPSATTTQKPTKTQTSLAMHNATFTYTPSPTMIPSMTSTPSMTQMVAMSSEETVTPTGEVTATVLPEATESQEVSPVSAQPQKQVTDTSHPKKGFRKSDGTAVVFVEDTTAEAPHDSDEKGTGAAVSRLALLTGGLIGYLVFIVLVGGLGIGLIALLIARRK